MANYEIKRKTYINFGGGGAPKFYSGTHKNIPDN